MPVPPPLSVSSILSDALTIYRLVFRRSVITAAIVFAFVEGLDVLSLAHFSQSWHRFFLIASSVATLAATFFVQGALIEVVRNIHEGRSPAPISELYGRAESRFWRLTGAALVYGLGVFLGFLALIVPGLLAAARWSLMAPAVMLEGATVSQALQRSRTLIRNVGGRDYTWTALGAIFISALITSAPLSLFNRSTSLSTTTYLIVLFVWRALTAPFEAHVLSVIYYRLVDPERPVIHPEITRGISA
jgi:hypothetical protein